MQLTIDSNMANTKSSKSKCSSIRMSVTERAVENLRYVGLDTGGGTGKETYKHLVLCM